MTDPFDYVREWNRRRAASGWWHSFELPDGTVIEGVCDLPGLKHRLAQFPIPADLSGKRVLDIGAWDGWFSFEMERRGAEVLAIDCIDNPRFHQMRRVFGSRVDFRQMDVYELAPERVGRFDIVLFMGVLYHLKHPLLALERVCAVTTELAAVDSFVLREHHRPGAEVESRPLMEFYETDEFGGQTDNWVGPSLPCLLAFCRTAGFARVELRGVLDHGACVACYRRWEPAPDPPQGAPELFWARHDTNFGVNFDTHSDDYIACCFAWPASLLSRQEVEPEVGGYGVQPISVAPIEAGHWQANFKLPPGLTPGWHEVRVRVAGSGFSNAVKIAVDMPAQPEELIIRGVRDGLTWKTDQVNLGPGTLVSLWIDGLPTNADCYNVRIWIGAEQQAVDYLGDPDPSGRRQVNIRLGFGIEPGEHDVKVRCGDRESAPVRLTVTLGGSTP